MNNQLQYFLCFFIAFNIAKGVSACELSDTKCLTKAFNWAMKVFVPGIEGVVEPSDPLFKEEIIGDRPTFKCHLFNVTLSGMTSCVITRVTLDPKNLKFEYFMRCPQLVLNAVGDVKGSLDSVQIEGNGKFKLSIDDYVLEIKGEYEKYIGEDNKPHTVKKTYTLDTDPVGDVKFEGTYQSEGKIKTDQQSSKLIEKLFRDPVIDACLDVFEDHISSFLRAFSIDDILLNGKDS